MIRKTKSGYRVVSKAGKNLGSYPTRGAAQKRLAQVEHFKSKPKRPK